MFYINLCGRQFKINLYSTFQIQLYINYIVGWKKEEIVECECGAMQNDQHLMQCRMINAKCEMSDLFRKANDEVLKLIN